MKFVLAKFAPFLLLWLCASCSPRLAAHRGIDFALSELFKMHPSGKIVMPLGATFDKPNFTPYKFIKFVPSLRKGEVDTLVIYYELYDSTWRANAHQFLDSLYNKFMKRKTTSSRRKASIAELLTVKNWAINSYRMEAYARLVEQAYAKGKASLFDDEEDDMEDVSTASESLSEGIMTIKVYGVMMPNGGLCSYGTKDYARWIYEADKDASVLGIFVDLDSFGGNPDSIQLLYQAVKDCSKPIVVYANNMCSAAYWAFCGADAIYASSYDTSTFGSIGVFCISRDQSEQDKMLGLKYTIITAEQSTKKVVGNPHEPLSKDDEAIIKQEATELCAAFATDVTGARGELDKMVFTGAAFTGRKSVELGLIDAVGNEQQAKLKLSNLIRRRTQNSAKS